MTLTQEQIKERLNYIGGSDAAAVLGLSRFKTPLAVWAEKTGLIEPEDISKELRIKMGNRLEEVVAELFTEETGKKVMRRNDTIIHPKYPFLCANIDRRVVGEDAILEVKTASAWMAREWEGEEIPLEYIIQVNHYMLVTGAKYAYIAVLIGGNQSFIWKRIDRDEKTLKQMEAKLVYFWNTFIVPKVQPDPASITAKDGDTLFSMYPNTINDAPPVQLTDESNRLVESIRAMQTDVDVVEKQIEAEKNRLKALLGENAAGTTGLYKVTWKEQLREAIDTKRFKIEQPQMAQCYMSVSKNRVLRISDEKKGE